MNWQKGFNRFWLLMTAVAAVLSFSQMIEDFRPEDVRESLQEIAVFVTALFSLVVAVFVSVVFFGIGHLINVVTLWVLSGFIKDMSFNLMDYNPFDIK